LAGGEGKELEKKKLYWGIHLCQAGGRRPKHIARKSQNSSRRGGSTRKKSLGGGKRGG